MPSYTITVVANSVEEYEYFKNMYKELHESKAIPDGTEIKFLNFSKIKGDLKSQGYSNSILYFTDSHDDPSFKELVEFSNEADTKLFALSREQVTEKTCEEEQKKIHEYRFKCKSISCLY